MFRHSVRHGHRNTLRIVLSSANTFEHGQLSFCLWIVFCSDILRKDFELREKAFSLYRVMRCPMGANQRTNRRMFSPFVGF
jgi:hypothetical protein